MQRNSGFIQVQNKSIQPVNETIQLASLKTVKISVII